VAQAFGDVRERVYAVKVQQPQRDWARIYHKAEDAFEVLSAHYNLEPHRRGYFKTRNCGLTMGNGSSVCSAAYILCESTNHPLGSPLA